MVVAGFVLLTHWGGGSGYNNCADNTKIVVATEHVAKNGSSKIVQQCALPLTGARCVSTIITDLVGLSLSLFSPPFSLAPCSPVDRPVG